MTTTTMRHLHTQTRHARRALALLRDTPSISHAIWWTLYLRSLCASTHMTPWGLERALDRWDADGQRTISAAWYQAQQPDADSLQEARKMMAAAYGSEVTAC